MPKAASPRRLRHFNSIAGIGRIGNYFGGLQARAWGGFAQSKRKIIGEFWREIAARNVARREEAAGSAVESGKGKRLRAPLLGEVVIGDAVANDKGGRLGGVWGSATGWAGWRSVKWWGLGVVVAG